MNNKFSLDIKSAAWLVPIDDKQNNEEQNIKGRGNKYKNYQEEDIKTKLEMIKDQNRDIELDSRIEKKKKYLEKK